MSISKKNYVIISPPTRTNICRILKLMGNENFKWIYLGEDIMNAINIKKLIGERGDCIDIADELQETARSLRHSYIDYIGDLDAGLRNWWATIISEKNPFISTTFLYICYLKVCKELLENNQSTHLVIFVKNHALRKTIFKNYSNLYKIKCFNDNLGDFSNDLKHQIINLVRKAHYVLTNILYILTVKYYYKLNIRRYVNLQNKSLILLRDWIDQRSFDSDGCYYSAYLGKLNKYFKSNGKNVLILPYILNINKKTLKQLIKSDEFFIIPHSFLNIKNVFSKLFINPPVLKSYPAFENLEITDLIKNDFKKDPRHFIDALMYYDLIENLKKSNFYFESCIYPYENYAHEKIFCIGMRTFYPLTKLIGYQHSIAPKMLLPYFFSNREYKSMPLPDKIITNGPYFTNLFRKEGYPIEKVISGSTIRYSYLYDKYSFRYIKNKKLTCNILVTTSAGINEALELIINVIKAFRDKPDYQIIIKSHPIMKTEIIKKYIQTFPSNFHFSEKPVSELLKEADLLIYTITAACFEALYVGIPVLHVKSNYIIDLDIFDYDHNFIYSAKNINEIIQKSDELLQMDEEKLKSRQTIWKKTVEDIFKPANESTYKLFDVKNE